MVAGSSGVMTAIALEHQHPGGRGAVAFDSGEYNPDDPFLGRDPMRHYAYGPPGNRMIRRRAPNNVLKRIIAQGSHARRNWIITHSLSDDRVGQAGVREFVRLTTEGLRNGGLRGRMAFRTTYGAHSAARTTLDEAHVFAFLGRATGGLPWRPGMRDASGAPQPVRVPAPVLTPALHSSIDVAAAAVRPAGAGVWRPAARLAPAPAAFRSPPTLCRELDRRP